MSYYYVYVFCVHEQVIFKVLCLIKKRECCQEFIRFHFTFYPWEDTRNKVCTQKKNAKKRKRKICDLKIQVNCNKFSKKKKSLHIPVILYVYISQLFYKCKLLNRTKQLTIVSKLFIPKLNAKNLVNTIEFANLPKYQNVRQKPYNVKTKRNSFWRLNLWMVE